MTTFSSPAAQAVRPLALLGLGLLGLAGCQTNIDGPTTAVAGNASFTRYIAVGNSLTAGYEDDGLYLEGQQNSYPSIVAQQLAQAGGGQFRQPLFATAQASGSGYLRLVSLTAAGPVTQRVPGTAGRGSNAANPPYVKYLDPIENFGVPGIKLADIQTVGYGSTAGNPYFERITPDASAGQTYFQRLKAEVGTPAVGTNPAVVSPNGNATFFSLWLGNNDVLSYATSGGALAGISSTYAITPYAAPADTFSRKATRLVTLLTSNGARGVVSNIPDVAGIPFFTTVGPSARARFAAANLPTTTPFVYTTGAFSLNPAAPSTKVVGTLGDIRDANGGTLLLTLTAAPYVGLYGQPTGKYYRDFYNQLKPSLPSTIPTLGVFLLAAGIDTTKAFGASTGNPFPSTLVLDGTEQTAVANATASFNASLLSAATARNLAFFDANQYFRNIATTGVATNGVSNTASFISGNLFSLDGVHPTPRGYALIANEIIRAINARYGGTVPLVNPNNYRGVLLP